MLLRLRRFGACGLTPRAPQMPTKLASVPLSVCFTDYKTPPSTLPTGSSASSDTSHGKHSARKTKKLRGGVDELQETVSASISAMYANTSSDATDDTIGVQGVVAPAHIVEDAMRYICERYLERRGGDDVMQTTKVHFTCATDTGQMQVVLDAVYEHLLVQYLDEADLL